MSHSNKKLKIIQLSSEHFPKQVSPLLNWSVTNSVTPNIASESLVPPVNNQECESVLNEHYCENFKFNLKLIDKNPLEQEDVVLLLFLKLFIC